MKYSNILLIFVIISISSVWGEQDLLKYFINNPKELGWALFYGRILQWSWAALWAFIAVFATFEMGEGMDYEFLMEVLELRLQLWP